MDNWEQKAAFYGLINMDGDGSAQNIIDKLSILWSNDGINVKKTCWLGTDNASTFTGSRKLFFIDDFILLITRS